MSGRPKAQFFDFELNYFDLILEAFKKIITFFFTFPFLKATY